MSVTDHDGSVGSEQQSPTVIQERWQANMIAKGIQATREHYKSEN